MHNVSQECGLFTNFSGRMTETVRRAVSSPTFQVSLSLRAYYGTLEQFHWGRDILNCPL